MIINFNDLKNKFNIFKYMEELSCQIRDLIFIGSEMLIRDILKEDKH